MKKKVLILIAALSFAAATLAQGEKTMYVMKGGKATHEIAVSDIDSIIFYNPDPCPECTVCTQKGGVYINGVCWATRNVDKPGTFTAEPEDTGMFYQWNSKVSWSFTDPLTPSDGTSVWDIYWDGNDATTWEKSNNPCPSGWRMPSQSELSSLVSSGYDWKTNGGQFGSGSNTLFLPAVGTRFSYDSTLYYAGSWSYYWSSTRTNASTAYHMNFYSGNAYVYIDLRANGFSCRCVAE